MFESVCDATGELDLGALAEAMLFYRRVHVVLSVARLNQIVDAIGAPKLADLIERGHLDVSFTPSLFGDHVIEGPTGTVHNVVRFSAREHAFDRLVPRLVRESMGTKGRSADRIINKLMRGIRTIDVPDHLIEAARTDLTTGPVVRAVLSDVAALLAPGVDRTAFRFAVTREEKGLHVESNVDFSKFAGARGLAVFNERHLIATFGMARMAAHLAAAVGGEIATDEITSIVLRATLSDLARRRNKSTEGIAQFQEFVLDGAGTVREAVNSGRRTFDDVMELLERADRFRDWLRDKPPDARLLKAYFDEVTKDSWAATEPGKAARWFLSVALAVVLSHSAPEMSTLATALYSLAETYLLERMRKGWRPDQFVNGALMGWIAGP